MTPMRCLFLTVACFATVAPAAEPKPDVNGDPLPPGVVMRLGETRFRPGARVQYLAFSPDGSKIVSCGNWMYVEDRISIWDAATGKELSVQGVAENAVQCIRWAAAGDPFAVVTRENQNGLPGFRIARASAASPGLPPPRAGQGGRMRVLGGQQANPVSYSHFDLSSDGTRLAAFRTGGGGVGIDLFEAKPCESGADLTKVGSIEPKADDCNTLLFVNGTKSLMVLSGGNGKGATVLTTTVYNVASGKVEASTEVPTTTAQGSRRVLDVAADGRSIVTGSEDGTVNLIDLMSGKKKWSITLPPSPNGKGWDAVSAVKFVPGDKVFVAGRNNRQFILDAAHGKTMTELHGHHSWVEAIADSPDGKRVASAGQDSLVRVWNAETWEPIAPPKGHFASVWKMDVSRDGRYLATVGGEGLARVWDLKTGAEVRTLPARSTWGNARFTPDGRAVVASGDKDAIQIFPLPDGPPTTSAATGGVLSFSPDGKTLATANGAMLTLWDWPAGTKRHAVSLGGRPHSAVFSPGGKVVLLGYDRNSAPIDVVDVATGELLPPNHAGASWYSDMYAVAPDGRTMYYFGSNRIHAWDLAARSKLRDFDPIVPARGQHFYGIGYALAPNARTAASANSDGTVSLFETATGQLRKTLDGHRCGVFRVMFTPDGKRLISAGEDHQVLVWDVTFAGLAGVSKPLAAADVAAAWDKLNAAKATDAAAVLAQLAADPKPAVAVLAKKLTPVPPILDAKQLDRIVTDLDDPVFAVREKASQELDALGEAAVGGIRTRLAAVTSAEVRKRVEAFLKVYGTPALAKERLWEARAFEWLGSVDSAEATALLKTIATGADGAWRTEEAKAVLKLRE